MDRNSFELLCKDAAKALEQNHLQNALTCIGGMIFNISDIELNNELESIQKDYEMMLGFMKQGGTDPQRTNIYRQLQNRASGLLDMSARRYRLQSINDLYTETYHRIHDDTVSDFGRMTSMADILREKVAEQPTEEDSQALYELYDKLFEYIWTFPLLKSDKAKELQSFIERQEENAQAMLLSAVMLSTLSYFDPQKFRILLHFCRTQYIKVRARAITAIVWTYMAFESRFRNYPDLCEGISLLASEPSIGQELIILQKQLILSLETAKAEKKLQNEILPDILKNRNYQRSKMGFEEVEEELAKALRGEPNAEWEKMRENKQLANNMKEIIEMGKEGIDINIGTFSSLKGFPFFKRISHWFAPFDRNRQEVKDILPGNMKNNPIHMIMEAGNFCDSDKYSLCMMLRQIMPSQREMMITQIGTQMDGQEDMVKEAVKEGTKTGAVYRSYLQNLYRFYKLYPQKKLFEDPFSMEQLLTRYDRLGQIVKTMDYYLMDMASFLIKREYYQDAIEYIEEVLKEETATAEMLQKIAFCHQHTGNPGKAVYYYQQADLLNPDNEWIIRQLYLCHSALGHHEQELDCLNRLIVVNPEDSKLISEIGLCLMQLKRYEEAAKRFYELEYKGERVVSSWRAIAWCNFKMNKLEQAHKYYQKILNHEKVTWEDHLNAGHTAWCMKLVTEAIGHYQTYIELFLADKRQKGKAPLQPYDQDKEELVEHGITELDIALMRDIIMPRQET